MAAIITALVAGVGNGELGDLGTYDWIKIILVVLGGTGLTWFAENITGIAGGIIKAFLAAATGGADRAGGRLRKRPPALAGRETHGRRGVPRGVGRDVSDPERCAGDGGGGADRGVWAGTTVRKTRHLTKARGGV